MKSFYLFLLAVLPFFVLAQQKKQKIFTNTKSSGYVSILGTKLSVFSPKGFSVANDFKGFRKDVSGSSIMVSYIPGNIKMNLAGFTKEALVKSGVFMIASEELRINGFQAVLIKAKQIAYQNAYLKWLLIIGNENETFLLTGTFLEKLEEEESKIILACLLSTIYEPYQKLNPEEGMAFKLNVSGTKLKRSKLVTNSLMYTTDGNMPPKAKDKTTFTATASLHYEKISDYKKYCIETMKLIPTVKNIPEKNIFPVTIDNMKGFEMWTSGKNQVHGQEEMIYQVVLFEDKMIYTLVGLSLDNFEENFP